MMPRNPRVHYPDAVYHVMSRGVEKRDIFLTDEDRRFFLVCLMETAREHGVSVLAHCLMGNHFHLLLAVSQTPLDIPMRQLLTRYALRFNRVHERVGHLFQSRYTAILCEDMGYLLQLVAYIHMNPVRAGFVPQPSDWPWSSHQELIDLTGPIIDRKRLEEVCGISAADLKVLYQDRLQSASEAKPSGGPTLQQLLHQAASIVGVSPSELTSGKRGKPYTRAKRYLAAWAAAEGFSLADLARALNCSKAAISLLLKRKS